MVLNQITETHRVADLAKIVSEITGAEIANLPNPRKEADENDLVVLNEQFLALGLNPTTLSNGLLDEVTHIADKYKHRVDPTKIIARSVWRKGMETAEDLITEIPDTK
jgi:UDP-sulfoquinovose synthase